MVAVTYDDIGLKVLRDAPSDAAEIIDIVAVHGIGAHPDDSWCKNVGTKESPHWVNWLEEENMLPAVAPQARIMRYGYQSQWFGEGAMRQKASIVAHRLLLALRRKREHSPYRPLLFIAHCFGGLVVVKALLDAWHEETEWPGTFASTTGLTFLGTPFRGAEGMSQAEMLAAAQCEYQQDEIQPEVLRILEPANEFLQELVDQFGKMRRQPNKAHVACFYELMSSNVGRIVGKTDRTRFVVSENSGCLDLSDATSKFSLSRTHVDMNKFGRPTEEDFETVRDVVGDMIQASPGLIAARSQCISKHKIHSCLRGVSTLKQSVTQDVEMQALKTKLKELLSVIPPAEIAQTRTMEQTIRETLAGPQRKEKTASKEHAHASLLDLRSNILDPYNIKAPQFGCQTCPKTFLTQDAANAHMAATGHGSPTIPCKSCTKKFLTQDAANGHMTATGHGSPTIPCKSCTKKFLTQDAANGHMTATGHGRPN
ncbi:hypothetical protein HBI23_253250 [Parastagonospora nodorum]|nr:hypothetical protein HBI23_253250 [Parastagonospora nodorum]KAH5621957.1 hypothetical protein HBI51_248940 [Parastagonospora nodorum]KAH5983389.1 hypothetical protein HBI84_247780 [Parastagonospora nodorum]KAH6133521.1 hypothetical protein HBI68_252800 [Parastagonospora nodorum]KAH6383967.1 hypothetical protein HBI60_252420 [Parastagonospora nodorum]